MCHNKIFIVNYFFNNFLFILQKFKYTNKNILRLHNVTKFQLLKLSADEF